MANRVVQALRQFTAVLLALATLVGAYVGAVAIDQLLLFWVIVPVSAILVLGWRAWPLARRVIYQVSDYSRLKTVLDEVTARHEELEQEIARLTTAVVEERLAGRRLGRQEALGAVVAVIAGATLQIIGVAVRKGVVVIGAALRGGTMPAMGALYDVSVSLTGERQGIMRVVELTSDGSGVLLEPQEETVPEFWQALRHQAVLSNDAPSGLVLKASRLAQLSDVETMTILESQLTDTEVAPDA